MLSQHSHYSFSVLHYCCECWMHFSSFCFFFFSLFFSLSFTVNFSHQSFTTSYNFFVTCFHIHYLYIKKQANLWSFTQYIFRIFAASLSISTLSVTQMQIMAVPVLTSDWWIGVKLCLAVKAYATVVNSLSFLFLILQSFLSYFLSLLFVLIHSYHYTFLLIFPHFICLPFHLLFVFLLWAHFTLLSSFFLFSLFNFFKLFFTFCSLVLCAAKLFTYQNF